mgnify:CR=1 FL=1
MITELEEEQLNNINAYLKINIIKTEPEKFIAIKNRDLHSCIEKYDSMKYSKQNSICEFASNASGMTSYHYLKLYGILYILQAWTGDIDEIYNVTDEWVNKHKILFENV